VQTSPSPEDRHSSSRAHSTSHTDFSGEQLEPLEGAQRAALEYLVQLESSEHSVVQMPQMQLRPEGQPPRQSPRKCDSLLPPSFSV
jgi:hypothetical protein